MTGSSVGALSQSAWPSSSTEAGPNSSARWRSSGRSNSRTKALPRSTRFSDHSDSPMIRAMASRRAAGHRAPSAGSNRGR
ncbi:hypothetical protein SK854_37560 [Lentzea sp. BCCO 10_0061]|uniref:Uncharacterized protein n=1 Tax=Lentzea sokolovensis TaxID=3095429 RepID=A0ABU4V8Q0_9PSEU|nr:hypothetical protein [Lentzea sp. BCCO 10_0061]MDX8147870.1 hypothetical protein [Lentzea sp. BCCO 10_0061]